MAVFGLIGGSGLYSIPGLEIKDSVKLTTPYGEPSDLYVTGTLLGRKIIFLPRHGSMHNIQPHKINYRANLWGLRELEAKRIISFSACGGISSHMQPGAVVLPDQLIDLTSGRESTFYDAEQVVHIDFSEPFCPDLRSHLKNSAEKAGVPVTEKGTYACTNGPRLETSAEVRALSLMGADIVGMTMLQEAVLARELELCFAGVSVVTNYAAGIVRQRLTTTEVVDTMKKSAEKIESVLKVFFERDLPVSGCGCGHALKDARM